MPILVVIGIDPEGERDVLAFCVGERENQDAWEALFEQVKERGVERIDLWCTDGHKAMLNALQLKFPTSQRQRCIKHKMENVLGYIPEKQQDLVHPELKAIFYQISCQKADQELAAFIAKYETIYPSAIDCLNRDQETCLTFYSFPEQHWKFIRTSNAIERLFGEVKSAATRWPLPSAMRIAVCYCSTR